MHNNHNKISHLSPDLLAISLACSVEVLPFNERFNPPLDVRNFGREADRRQHVREKVLMRPLPLRLPRFRLVATFFATGSWLHTAAPHVQPRDAAGSSTGTNGVRGCLVA